jgi:hypothetical protein
VALSCFGDAFGEVVLKFMQRGRRLGSVRSMGRSPPSAIRKLLINSLAATGLTDINGDPLMFQAHDFRRIFVTDAIMNGLPPHIALAICGHNTKK